MNKDVKEYDDYVIKKYQNFLLTEREYLIYDQMSKKGYSPKVFDLDLENKSFKVTKTGRTLGYYLVEYRARPHEHKQLRTLVFQSYLKIREQEQSRFTHYDINTDNILITDDSDVLFIDFEFSYMTEVPYNDQLFNIHYEWAEVGITPYIYDQYYDLQYFLQDNTLHCPTCSSYDKQIKFTLDTSSNLSLNEIAHKKNQHYSLLNITPYGIMDHIKTHYD